MMTQLPVYDLVNKEILPAFEAQVEYERGGNVEPPKKFNYFQTHHEILGPLLSVFGFQKIFGTSPADSMSIQLMKKKGHANRDNDYKVVLQYIRFDLPEHQHPHKIELSLPEFYNLINTQFHWLHNVFGQVKSSKEICETDLQTFMDTVDEKHQ